MRRQRFREPMTNTLTGVREKRRLLQHIADQVNDSTLSTIQQTIPEILRITSDPDTTAKDLKELLEKDPVLASAVLKRANSAYYARSRSISDIEQAVIWLGFDSLKELALNQKVSEMFRQNLPFAGYSRVGLWKHSMAVAICANLIYRREFGERGENAYAAGLLHNIGVIILDQCLHADFKEIFKQSESQQCNLHESEVEILGVNHAEVGKFFAHSWNFPAELIQSIGAHHNPENVRAKGARLAKTIYIADFICQKMGFGFTDMPYEGYTLFSKLLSELAIQEERLDIIITDVETRIYRMVAEGWFKQ
ncbi:MAG: HDOD domain-containing protein [Candidatus Marinimicrobia bacterium]|nr:HDOD domain-containing protein [Candidatus Neomarinimicrobiota bacterium]